MPDLRNVATLPWTHGVRVMPDVRYGLGATVGSVIAMEQAVAPAAVGVDIGCGMTVVETTCDPISSPTTLLPSGAGSSVRCRWASQRTTVSRAP